MPSEIIGNSHTRNFEKNECAWNRTSVVRILKNLTYLGCAVNRRMKKINYKSKKEISVPKEDWIIVENTHEPIIDKETFDIVQKHIESRTNTRVKKYDWLLNGIIICEECQKKLSILGRKLKKSDKRTFYLRCNTYSSNIALNMCTPHTNNLQKTTDLIIETIKNRCKQYLEDEKYKDIAQKTNLQYSQNTYIQKEISCLNKKIALIDKKINSLYEDKLEGIINVEDFKRIYGQINKEKDNLKLKIETLKKEQTKKGKNVDLNKIVKEFLKMKEITRSMLVQLVDKITISEKKEINIYYKFNVLNEKNNDNNLLKFVS